jgi:hypothetical protein
MRTAQKAPNIEKKSAPRLELFSYIDSPHAGAIFYSAKKQPKTAQYPSETSKNHKTPYTKYRVKTTQTSFPTIHLTIPTSYI